MKVIRELVRQMPELAWREEADDPRRARAQGRPQPFSTSLFNRQAMPLTFGVFDGTPEFDNLADAMVGYDRR